jgi:hypothetical protein
VFVVLFVQNLVAGRVTLPPLPRAALERYPYSGACRQRRRSGKLIPPLVGNIADEAGIQRARLWVVMRRFFATVADLLLEDTRHSPRSCVAPPIGCAIRAPPTPCKPAVN